jgi:nitrogen fixation/metabolism regulation signal transduction histidine kinase
MSQWKKCATRTGFDTVDWLQFTVNLLFILLLASIILWIGIYRRLNSEDPRSSPRYRWHQWLVGLIALLAIMVAVVIVFSSDPGDIDDYFLWP